MKYKDNYQNLSFINSLNKTWNKLQKESNAYMLKNSLWYIHCMRSQKGVEVYEWLTYLKRITFVVSDWGYVWKVMLNSM